VDVAKAPARRLRRLARGADSPGSTKELWALKDVSFEVQPGEAVGVIGHNGAGKSTLLKVLSRITHPTSGEVVTRGRVGSLLEVGTGFHHELTGRENVFLNGAILGMRRREIEQRFDEIIDFAEIGEFLDTPVKRYSSGMYVRLAFSVAAHLNPDILLIDEVLAVGDLRFQRKCMEHAKRLRERNSTVLLVSHNMFAIKAMCTRAVYMSHGNACFIGSPEEAISLYEKDSRITTASWARDVAGADGTGAAVFVTDIETLSSDGRPKVVFEYGEQIRLRMRFVARRPLADANFSVAFIRSDNVACCNHNTVMDGCRIDLAEGEGTVELLTPPLKLVSEMYTIHVLVWDREFKKLHNGQVGPSFHVRHELLSTHFGVFHEPAQWAMSQGEAAPGTDGDARERDAQSEPATGMTGEMAAV
jgi:lipopolysaccharide transport system ATP-binding protein